MKSKLTILLNENQYRQIFKENQTESLESYQQKLKQMIESGDEDNIRLAFSYESAIQADYPQFDMESFIHEEYDDLLLLLEIHLSQYGNELEEDIVDHLIMLFTVDGLDLSENDSYNLPENIGVLKNLTWLNFYAAHLGYLPASFSNLKNLKSLNLDENYAFQTIPEEVLNLTSLEDLSIDDLNQLPENIGNLTNLKNLNISYARNIKTLPNSFSKLTALESLNLSGTGITNIPDYFKNFKNLQRLDLSYLEISEDEIIRIRQILPNTEIIFE
jgi:Leucine-rich repeat (LRR) protein